MATTNFVDQETAIVAAWLNDVDQVTYDAQLSVKSLGATGNGVTNDAAACLLGSNTGLPVRYPVGTYYIDTNTTLVTPIILDPGAQFVVNTGKVLTINAPVYAGSRQYIFNGASGAIVGTFGRVAIWADWFGAVPDSSISVTPSGTDSGIGINKAIVAIQSSSWIHGVVNFNPGIYFIGTGVVSNSTGIRLAGAGKYKTILTTTSAYTGKVIQTLGTAGPPNSITGFGIVSAIGGSLSATGIQLDANGSFVSDVWVTGFYNGITCNSTDQEVCDFVCEYNSNGIYILSTAVNIHDGITFMNAQGVLVGNSLNSPGKTHINNVRSEADSYAGFGITNSTNVILTSCSTLASDASKYTYAGFYVNGTSGIVDFTGCVAYLGAQATASVGFLIEGSVNPEVTLSNCTAYQFNIGLYINTVGGVLNVSGGKYSGNYTYGIKGDAFNYLTINGSFCSYNWHTGAADSAGIYIAEASAYQRLLISSTQCNTGGVILQKYGIHVTCSNANAYGSIYGNITAYNATTGILIDGANSANITTTGANVT
jgi:hypothetical protein